ncbi:MAG: 2'-5' RNA ligase family protein [Deltaproteobacteria bacterium]|nr:2'-5' RNA ligase family protein [Deltaproteobacteria bacterium]
MNMTRLIIITVPPKEIADRVQQLRTPICEKYQAPWALTYPPHITLRTGVIVPQDNMENYLSDFTNLIKDQKPFRIRTDKIKSTIMRNGDDWKFFIYLPVIQDHALIHLNRHLLSYCRYRKSNQISFYPHMTLLWDSLTVKEQEEVKATMNRDRRFTECYEWMCDNVSLYIRKEDHWVPFHVFRIQ